MTAKEYNIGKYSLLYYSQTYIKRTNSLKLIGFKKKTKCNVRFPQGVPSNLNTYTIFIC